MAPSQAGNNAIGAIGGAILAACFAPQLVRLVRTRSAHDLSYIFLSMYNAGLVLTFVYLFFEGATVAYICILVEVSLGITVVAAKVYLDTWGPHSRRRRRGGRGGGGLTFASLVKDDLASFLDGSSAPFPLMRPLDTHLAQHLLLDVQLPAGEAEAGGDALAQLAAELEAALDAAGARPPGAQQQQQPAARQFHSFASFRRDKNGDAPGGGGDAFGGPAAPDTVYLPCADGYVTALYWRGSRSLLVDMLAASADATARLDAAARAFVAALRRRHGPGVRAAATTMARVPVR